MPLKILFTTNNCPILSSSKMLLAFAFPSVQPESSNKTPKYCTRHCARGFSHIKDELLSMGTSQPFLDPACFLLFFSWFRLIQTCHQHTISHTLYSVLQAYYVSRLAIKYLDQTFIVIFFQQQVLRVSRPINCRWRGRSHLFQKLHQSFFCHFVLSLLSFFDKNVDESRGC